MTTNCRKMAAWQVTLASTILVLGLATSAFAQNKSELDNRVRKLMAQFDSLQSNAEARIPSVRFERMLEYMVEASGDPLFGLHTAQYIQPGSYSVMGYIAMNSSTIGEALARAKDFTGNALGFLGKRGDDFARRPAYVIGSRNAIDLRQAGIDAQIAKVAVENTETDVS